MSAEARRDVYQAISDPTRRKIINLIAHQSMNLNTIADQFDISRPAISNHIKILRECGMLEIRKQGRERYCEAKLDTLREISDWVQKYSEFWNQKFDSLENYISKVQTKNKLK